MTWIYADYLHINQDFIAVFSEEIDKQDRQAWKAFIPHPEMRNLLAKLVKALERGSKADIKSLWVHGSYGTGKTFAAFVLKHLLEDEPAEVENYFAVHALDQDLKTRLLALKNQGKFLVVYRSSTAHVDSNRKLLAEVQESVRETLRQNGLGAAVGLTLLDAVLEKIGNPESAFDWERAFRRHRAEFPNYASGAEVVQALRSSRPAGTANPEAWRTTGAPLLDTVCSVMEKEGFLALDDPARVKQWLKEVIALNRLKGLVFIWDEFADFFYNNRSTSGLQELAHATAEFPFYLILVMHRSAEILVGREEDRQHLLDRFHDVHYQMEPITAYQLIQRTIQVKEERRDEWETRRTAAWDRVQGLANRLATFGEKCADFQQLVPLHPYAAFLVSTISRQFSSSQRTLFQFLKEREAGSFQSFLSEYPKDDWHWYTADNLWDYFFAGAERDIAERVRDVVGYYRTRLGHLGDDDERRVFKAIMLFVALNKELVVEDRVKPTRDNLLHLFRGTPLCERLDAVVGRLAEREVVRVLANPLDGNDEYAIPLVSADPRVIRGLKSRVPEFRLAAQPGGDLGAALTRLFGEDDRPVRKRQVLTSASGAEFSQRRERVAPTLQPYQVGVVCIAALEENELLEAERLAAELAPRCERTVYVVAQTHFRGRRWEEWVNHKAHALYYQERQDAQNETYHSRQADAKVGDWLDEVRRSPLQVYFRDKHVNANGVGGFDDAFAQAVDEWFPYRQELLANRATLFTSSYGTAGAKIGLGIARHTSQHADLIERLQSDGFWEEDPSRVAAARRAHPDHPLARMMDAVEEEFSGADGANLNSLWERLQTSPLGLTPSLIGSILFGYLMRPYCQGYFWTDGTNFMSLNVDKMADLVYEVMRDKRMVTIHRQTPEATEFCALLRSVFGLTEERTEYPGKARDALREYLKVRGYPLWALQHVPSVHARGRLRSIDELSALISRTDAEANSLDSALLGRIVQALRIEQETLKSLVAERRAMSEGMPAFFNGAAPDLLPAARRLGLDVAAICARLRDVMNEEVWLWREDQVEERLPRITEELDLISALNDLLGRQDQQLADAVNHLRQMLAETRLPLSVLAESAGAALAPAFNGMKALCASGQAYGQKRHLAEMLGSSRDAIRAHYQAPAEALVRWTQATFETSLTPAEAERIWGELPENTLDQTAAEFKRIVEAHLRALTRRRLVEQLQSAWRRVSGSASPQEWSEHHLLPVRWVLNQGEEPLLLSTVCDLEAASEQNLQKAMAVLGQASTADKLGASEVEDRRRFLSVVAGEYVGLLSSEDIEDMRQYCRTQARRSVMEWDLDSIRNLAHDWIKANYARRMQPLVLDRIERMDAVAMRRLLGRLAEDPLLGTRIMGEMGGRE